MATLDYLEEIRRRDLADQLNLMRTAFAGDPDQVKRALRDLKKGHPKR